jgi:hydroxymethylglutaryl-CoA lyase
VEGQVIRPALPASVVIREVGPRDGLQAEAPLPPASRAALIDALADAGLRKIEAVSFVSETLVPAMAGAGEVWSRVRTRDGVRYSALVPNRRGAEAAVAAGGFGALQAFVSASDGYNRKNVGKGVEESMGDVADVIAVGSTTGIPVEVSLSAAFGDPYGDGASTAEVVRAVERLAELGAAGVSLGDTTGMATPTRVWDLLGALGERVPGVRLNLHFHDTRGTAMANVLAALQAGVGEFDASIGGMGGSPFAPGANGNVATEDLAAMLHDMGIEVGVDLTKLAAAASLAAELVGHELPGHLGRAPAEGEA